MDKATLLREHLATHLLVYLRQGKQPLSNLETGSGLDLMALLRDDPRFEILVEDEGEEPRVGRRPLAREMGLLGSLDSWREAIHGYLMDRKPVELSVIGTSCPRPHDIPPDIKLKDVMMSDSRFHLSGEGTDMKAKLRLGEQELLRLQEEWKDCLYRFLVEKNRFMNMSELGGSVPRPAQLPGSIKLLDTLRADSSMRFKVVGDGNELKVKGVVSLEDPSFRVHFEEWRSDVARYIAIAGQAVELGELGFKVRRPGCLKGISLQQMLLQDPLRRFMLWGKVNHVRVGLAANSSPSQHSSRLIHASTPSSSGSEDSGLRTGKGKNLFALQTASVPAVSRVSSGKSFLDALKNSPPSTPALHGVPPPGFEHRPALSLVPVEASFSSLRLSSAFSFLDEPDEEPSPARRSYKQIRVDEWLAVVFADYEPTIATVFSTRLREEAGFLSVQDLQDARGAGYLSAELLARICGMKIGHYSRLMKALGEL